MIAKNGIAGVCFVDFLMVCNDQLTIRLSRTRPLGVDPLGPPHPLYPPLLLDVTERLLLDVTEGLLLDVTVGNNNQQRGQNTCLGG